MRKAQIRHTDDLFLGTALFGLKVLHSTGSEVLRVAESFSLGVFECCEICWKWLLLSSQGLSMRVQ